jgi:hypothetical protein
MAKKLRKPKYKGPKLGSIKAKNADKRVNVILIKDIEEGKGEDGAPIIIKAYTRLLRTTRSFAEQLIATGNYARTNKAKLHSFMKKDVKLAKNINTIMYLQELTGEEFPQKRLNGKAIVVVPNIKLTNRYNQSVPGVKMETTRRLVDKKIRVDGYFKTNNNGQRVYIAPKRYRKGDKKRFMVREEKEVKFYKPNKATIKKRFDEDKSKDRGKTIATNTGSKILVIGY